MFDQELSPEVRAQVDKWNQEPAVAEAVTDTVEEQQEAAPTAVAEPLEALRQPEQQPSAQELNFRAIREKAERAERERDEMLRRIAELEASRQQKPSPTPVEEDIDLGIGDNDIAEGKHLSKLKRELKENRHQLREMQQMMKQYQQQTAEVSAETRLKVQFPDFDTVVSRDNIERFKLLEPEMAQSIASSTDTYSKGVTVYKMMKKLGIYQDPALYKENKERAQQNAAKPRPLASVSPQQGDSPLSKANAFANGLTKELQDQLLREMAQARKQI